MTGTAHHPRPYNPDGPIAYLLTFRCYGTWLHGDPQGSMDRRGHNVYGEPRLPASENRLNWETQRMAQAPMRLNSRTREMAAATIRAVCRHRDWVLHASSVQCDHIHIVVAPDGTPEAMMQSLKAWITRRLRESGLLRPRTKLWSRHGSTKYLWTEYQVDHAMAYVQFGQSLPPDM